MKKYRNYTDDDIKNHVASCTSMSQLLKKLNLRATGGNYANMKRNLQRLKCDTSHWKGQGWAKELRTKDWKNYTKAATLKPHLVKERGSRCEVCLNEEWLGVPIVIELHHIDGDRTNNEKSNLQLLCPNCHATTDGWRNRKK